MKGKIVWSSCSPVEREQQHIHDMDGCIWHVIVNTKKHFLSTLLRVYNWEKIRDIKGRMIWPKKRKNEKMKYKISDIKRKKERDKEMA